MTAGDHADKTSLEPVRRRVAQCQCGQLSISVPGEPLGVGICHCLACQRRTGSVFAALAVFAAPWEVVGEARDFWRTGDAGARFCFRFCPNCGTNLFHTEEGEQDTVSVAVGGFADPDFPPPQVSVYDCRRHGWLRLPDGVTAYPRDPQWA
ncbi:MAG: GFA family protein [Neomegalonema sp.]|nr:GFA family protein [Neomegalonema sp.]